MITTIRVGALAAALVAAVGLRPAAGDILHLATGAAQECVILEITDQRVTYRTEMGRASLPRSKIVAITEEPDEYNRHLLKKWEAAEAAEEARGRAHARQKRVERLRHEALGEVQYKGEWMSPEEKTARIEAEREAKAAAARLDRAEDAAGHRFAYGVWMTPETHEELREKERNLERYTQQMKTLQERVRVYTDQIENLRTRMMQESDLEELDKLAKRIEETRKNREEVSAEILAIRQAGDEVAENIEMLVRRARRRLQDMLSERGESVESLHYIKGPR